MRKYFLLFLVIVLSIALIRFARTKDISSVSAQLNTSEAQTVEDKEIQNLKDKIASKVAELKQLNQKALAGRITKIATASVSILGNDDKPYNVKNDEALTKIYQISGSTKDEIKLSDLKVGNYIIVTGPVAGSEITANYVYRDQQFLVNSGRITEVNKDDYYLKVITTDKEEFTLDIEAITSQLMLNINNLEVERTGFSKIKEGDTIHFIYQKTGEEKETNRYPAHKILIIAQESLMK